MITLSVHCTNIQMVMSGYQFMNLKFVHLSKKHANRTPTFGNGFSIQKILQKAVQVFPLY